MRFIASSRFTDRHASSIVRSRLPGRLPGILACVCLFAAIFGCQARGNDVAEASSAGGGGAFKIVALPDDSFGGMPATEISVPRGWQAQGQEVISPCTTLPFPTWDAISPDRQNEMHVLPTFGWRWGTEQRTQGCIPLDGPLNAADFLQKFAARLSVRVVETMPVDDKYRQREVNFSKILNGQNSQLLPVLRTRHTGDVAAMRVIDASGHEMRLRAWVQCADRPQGILHGGDCFAKVDILRTPKGRLNALVAVVDSHNLVQDRPTPQFSAAYSNHQRQVAAQQMNAMHRRDEANSQMLHNQYVQSTARLREEHEAGMEQIQRQGQDANRNAMNAMNARSTAASDWRDYAADQQTVSGVNGTYKTSSQYSNVWSSPYGPPLSSGRTFGSTDNTRNPNGATDNTWTKDHKVHGNGQPY